jgi:hypothetical protein
MKNDAPQSLTTVKMWHDDRVWDKTCIKFEQYIKYLYNASNKQYASLPEGQGARRGRGSLGDRRGWGAQGGEDLLTTCDLSLFVIWKMKNYEILI